MRSFDKFSMLSALGLLVLSMLAFVKAGDSSKKTVFDVDLYYESLCPDSIYFINKQLVPAYPELKDHLNINFVPYGKASHSKNPETGAWTFTCQHGNSECVGNKAQACGLSAIESSEALEDRQRLSVNFVGCVMSTRYPATAVPQCAQKLLSQKTQDLITECVSNNQSGELLAVNGDKTHGLQPPLSFVPTIIINKVYSADNQKKALSNFAKLICDLLPVDEKPSTCPP